MYGDAIVIQQRDRSVSLAKRLSLGQTNGRDEAWLRDLLFSNPGAIPIGDLDPSFGPLVPLCRELRTEAGPVDVALINRDGLLTLVECKLWRNPEARRKVVAQVLDYARAVARWSYADLQRQVSVALGRSGNVPFLLAQSANPDLEEHRFVDAAFRAMRSGRFQLIVAGDGIREDVSAIAELVNRNAASAFSFSMLEVALYDFDGALAIQPRVVAKTVNLERTVVLVRSDAGEVAITASATEPVQADDTSPSAAREERARWWAPLEGIQFDDPEQEPGRFTWPNNLITPLPGGLWLSAYRAKARGGECGVFLSGRAQVLQEVTRRLLDENVLADLPVGASEGRQSGLLISRLESDFGTVEDEHRWLAETLNDFVNVLRPRLKHWPARTS